MSSVPSWATYDPKELGSSATPYAVSNFVDGKWTKSKTSMDIPHPMDRDSHPIFTVPDTQADEIAPFLESLRKVSKSGKHNPLKNNDRYVKYGEIARLVSFKLC
jgi:1-pyrroline-5-carboxylate dehydrogenase